MGMGLAEKTKVKAANTVLGAAFLARRAERRQEGRILEW